MCLFGLINCLPVAGGRLLTYLGTIFIRIRVIIRNSTWYMVLGTLYSITIQLLTYLFVLVASNPLRLLCPIGDFLSGKDVRLPVQLCIV